MREKTSSSKKKTAAPPRRNALAARSQPKSPRASKPYFVTLPAFTVAISQTRPKDAVESPSFATFALARQAAIDAVVETIEEAERSLAALKRAASSKDLP